MNTNKKFLEAKKRFSSLANLESNSKIELKQNIKLELIYLPNDKNVDYIVGDEIALNGRIENIYLYLSFFLIFF